MLSNAMKLRKRPIQDPKRNSHEFPNYVLILEHLLIYRSPEPILKLQKTKQSWGSFPPHFLPKHPPFLTHIFSIPPLEKERNFPTFWGSFHPLTS